MTAAILLLLFAARFVVFDLLRLDSAVASVLAALRACARHALACVCGAAGARAPRAPTAAKLPWKEQRAEWQRARDENRHAPLDSYSMGSNREYARMFGLNARRAARDKGEMFGQARLR